MNNRWIALIPVYQPTEELIPLLIDLQTERFDIVIVDDGSTTGAEIFDYAEAFGKVLHHKENQGKGAALKTGLTYIKEKFPIDSIVVTVDGDGQHKVLDAVHLCTQAENNSRALYLGSRRFVGKVPLRSKCGNTITRYIFRFTTGLKVSDTQTGLRAFSARLIPSLLEIDGDKYEYEMNMLLESPKYNIEIKEIPIETIYINGNSSSHFHTIRDSYRIYREIFKYASASFVSFLIDYSLFELFFLLLRFTPQYSITVSNVLARIISGSINFSLNRNMVFHSDKNIAKSALEYIALACMILAGNTVVLTGLITYMHVNAFAAKLITEIFFFFISWAVQKHVIFASHKPASI